MLIGGNRYVISSVLTAWRQQAPKAKKHSLHMNYLSDKNMAEMVFKNPGHNIKRHERWGREDLTFSGEQVERDVALRDRIPHAVVFGIVCRRIRNISRTKKPEEQFKYLLQYRPLETRPDGRVKIYPHTLTVTVGGVDPNVSSSAFDTIKREAREELGIRVARPLVHIVGYKKPVGGPYYAGQVNPKHPHFVGAICSVDYRGRVKGVKTKVSEHKQTRFYTWAEIQELLAQTKEDAPEYEADLNKPPTIPYGSRQVLERIPEIARKMIGRGDDTI